MLNNINEIWRQCTHVHEVSNLGNVRNIHTKSLLKLQYTTTGYLYITIRNYEGKKRKHLKVHRLVAKAFIPNPENKPFINHIDGNPLNNNVNNLEWCTHAENIKHASDTGLFKTNKNLNRPKGTNRSSFSKYHYVGFDVKRNKWTAGISIKGKRPLCKRFDTEIEAAKHVNYIIDTLNLVGYPKNNV